MSIIAKIAESTIRFIQNIDPTACNVLLIRHSARPSDPGLNVLLTEEGLLMAEELGKIMGTKLSSVCSSPVFRCVQTGLQLIKGSGKPITISQDIMLSGDELFVLDFEAAKELWKGLDTAIEHLCCSKESKHGLGRPDNAARFLIKRIFASSRLRPGLHVFVAHDIIIAAVMSHILGTPIRHDEMWPKFLDSALFTHKDGKTTAAYRDASTEIDLEKLCPLDAGNVIELARRETGVTLGINCDANFTLAGGAFKSLLNGHAVRNLNLWPASEDDKKLIRTALKRRGAKFVRNFSHAESYEITGRRVDIANTPAPTEKILAGFDLGLSAVAAKYKNGEWVEHIDLLAKESVAKKQVLLLQKAENLPAPLDTLHRLYRYADELAFAVPESAEMELLECFKKADSEKQLAMLNFLKRN